MDSHEFFEALGEIGKEKNVKPLDLIEKIKTAMALVARKESGGATEIFVTIDAKSEEFSIEVGKIVADEVLDPANEISEEQAHKIDKKAKVGDLVKIKLDTKKVGRIAAQSAKQVIKQGIREVEQQKMYDALKDKEGQILTVKVHQTEGTRNFTIVKIEDHEMVLPKTEQMPNEALKEGDLIKVYVSEVLSTEKGPKVLISRTNAEFVKKLFELEVPEISNGVVKVMAIAREAGFRTKIAVASTDPQVDPVGTCIGQRGSRINQILDQLGKEKIDIVRYSSDLVEFVKSALLPAEVISISVTNTEEQGNCCTVIVDPSQVSLAIGARGQNVRLAARLTGCKIDIHKPGEEDGNLPPAPEDAETGEVVS